MNNKTALEYIKFAYYMLNTKQSILDYLDQEPEDIDNHIKLIINDQNIEKEIINSFPMLNKLKPVVNHYIKNNMTIYGTNEEEATLYESHCHNCKTSIQLGEKYCSKGCYKCVEDFNYDCCWGKTCKMCYSNVKWIVL